MLHYSEIKITWKLVNLLSWTKIELVVKTDPMWQSLVCFTAPTSKPHHIVTWPHFGCLANSSDLWPFAAFCSHMTMIDDIFFVRSLCFLPVSSKSYPKANNLFGLYNHCVCLMTAPKNGCIIRPHNTVTHFTTVLTCNQNCRLNYGHNFNSFIY